MPGYDRSGPIGTGPATGGGRGRCRRPAGIANGPFYGRGYGCGRGMGFRHGGGNGWRRDADLTFSGYGALPACGFGDPASKTDEIEMLQANADAMQRSLEAIQSRIAELEKTGSE